MALIDYIDGPNRDIYLGADTIDASIHPIDIYKEMRTLRSTDESLRKFDLFLQALGNEPKTDTDSTERYVKELLNTRIIPFDTTHVLTIIGTIITDDAKSGVDCFDRTPLSPTTIVDINYIPKQVEVITVPGGSPLTQPEHDQLMSLFNGLTAEQLIDLSFIKDIEDGNWERVGSQMIFKTSSDVEIARFNLFKFDGFPATETDIEVAKRVRV